MSPPRRNINKMTYCPSQQKQESSLPCPQPRALAEPWTKKLFRNRTVARRRRKSSSPCKQCDVNILQQSIKSIRVHMYEQLVEYTSIWLIKLWSMSWTLFEAHRINLTKLYPGEVMNSLKYNFKLFFICIFSPHLFSRQSYWWHKVQHIDSYVNQGILVSC